MSKIIIINKNPNKFKTIFFLDFGDFQIFSCCTNSNNLTFGYLFIGIRYTTFDDWLKIDKVEIERGKAVGKPREKICNIEEMLKIAGV